MRERFASLWNIMAGARLRYGCAVAALIAASIFLYVVPLIVQATIDGVIVRTDDLAAPTRVVLRVIDADSRSASLARAAGAILFIAAIAAVFTYLRGRWAALATETVIRRLRDRVYDHLQRLPCRYHDRAASGDLLQRSTSDVETIRTFLETQVVEIGRAIVMLIVPLPLMFAIDWRMAVASLVLVPIVVLHGLYFFRRIRRAFVGVDEAEAALTATAQENLSGIRTVRAYARQQFEEDRFEERNVAHRDLDRYLFRVVANFWSGSDLICLAQKGLVVAFGAFLLERGLLSVGSFFYFISAVTMFIWPVRMMGRIFADLGKALVALDRLKEVLEEPEEDAGDHALHVGAIRGAIEFSGVTFAHDEGSPVLRDVSFSVPPGATIAFVGPSGCGKTTVIELLLRLYDYRDGAGSIRIDGRELAEWDRRAIRKQTAVVMQEPFLYSRSLRDNIMVTSPTASEQALHAATVAACVHETIEGFDDGYDTLVGERGVTLSGGQRQRVAIARALIGDPPLLVLDDALSAVDAETEATILDALRHRHGVQTTLVVAHRLGTVVHADQIVVLEEGAVVQVGTHAELAATPGLYRTLLAAQSADAVEGPIDV